MKAMMIGSFVATLVVFQGTAQRGEHDDMYFKAKDREKLNASVSANDKIDSDYNAFKKKHFDEAKEITETANPTDSYSARNLNPEYISRSNSEQASEDEQNYYVEGYTPNTFDSYSSGIYNNYSSNLSNTNYNNSYSASSWNSYNPYYGYNGYCDPWMSPYYGGGSGLMISLSYAWGSGSYNPYSYYPSSYSPYYPNYYGYSSNYYRNNYYGSSEPPRINYGKRPSRHSAIVNPTPRSRHTISSNTDGSTNGRTSQAADEYYVKPSKRVSSFESTVRDLTQDRFRATDFPKTRESYNSTHDSKPTYSAPSRSSTSPSSPSRPSAGSSPRSRNRD